MKNVAVEGMMITISPSTVLGVEASRTPASNRLKADNKKVYLDKTEVTYSSLTQGAFVGSGSFVINASNMRVKSENKPVLAEGDKSDAKSITLKNPNTGATIKIPMFITIASAGQTRSKI